MSTTNPLRKPYNLTEPITSAHWREFLLWFRETQHMQLKQYDCTYRTLPDGAKKTITRHCPNPCAAIDLIHREFQLAVGMAHDGYEIIELKPQHASPYDLPLMKNPNLKEVKLESPVETECMDFLGKLPQGKLSV